MNGQTGLADAMCQCGAQGNTHLPFGKMREVFSAPQILSQSFPREPLWNEGWPAAL